MECSDIRFHSEHPLERSLPLSNGMILFIGEQMDAQLVRMIRNGATPVVPKHSHPAPPFVLSIYSNFYARGLAF
jgi:hypothetical protein